MEGKESVSSNLLTTTSQTNSSELQSINVNSKINNGPDDNGREGELVPCLLTIKVVAFRKYMVCIWNLNSQLLAATGALYVMVPYYTCDPQAFMSIYEHLCQFT